MRSRRMPLRELLIRRYGDDGALVLEWVCRSQPSYPAPLIVDARGRRMVEPEPDWTVELAGEASSPQLWASGLPAAADEWLSAAPGFARVCFEADGGNMLADAWLFAPRPPGSKRWLFTTIVRTSKDLQPSFPLRVAWPAFVDAPADELHEAVDRGLLELVVDPRDAACTFMHVRSSDWRRSRAPISIVHGYLEDRPPDTLVGVPELDANVLFVDPWFDANGFYLRLLAGWPLDRAACAATPADARAPILCIGPGVETRLLPDRLLAAETGREQPVPLAGGPAPAESPASAPRPRSLRVQSELLAELREPQALTHEVLDLLDSVSKSDGDGHERIDTIVRARAGDEARRLIERIHHPAMAEQLEPEPRVTHACFHCDGEELVEPVRVDTPIGLWVAVVPKRVARGGISASVPEAVLREMFEGDEATVDVCLFVLDRDWSAPRREAKLTLPRLGPSRERVDFELIPRRPGSLPVRIGLYARDILLQSFSARLPVLDEAGACELAAPCYTLDYVANGDFALLDELDERAPALSLFINRAGDSHWIGAVTDQREPVTLALSDAQVLPFIEPTRTLLEDVHGAFVDAAGSPERPAWLDRDLVRLGCRGRELHAHVFAQFEQRGRFLEVADRLAVARIDRDAPQLPWSLLYDYPLLTDPERVSVCPRARDRGPLELGVRIPCLDDPRCRARLEGEKHVCPYGFWGFRHRVEVNLGHNPALAELDPTAWSALDERVVEAREVRYAYSPWIEQSERHVQQLEAASQPLQLRVSADGDEIRRRLREPAEELLYLLCHGRHKDDTKEFYLEFVADEQEARLSLAELQPSMFGHFEARPFVVILNACESAAIGPGTVHRVLDALRQLGAVAIIGTEVEVKRRYALEFGPKLLAGLIRGEPLAEVMYSLRWAGLYEAMDPSGLVYTAYGPGSLRVIVDVSSP